MFHHVESVDRGLPFARLDEVQEQIDGGRLAGAIRSEQTEHVTAFDGEIQVVECGMAVVVTLGQTSSLEHWRFPHGDSSGIGPIATRESNQRPLSTYERRRRANPYPFVDGRQPLVWPNSPFGR
jgi:hypothetical protein